MRITLQHRNVFPPSQFLHHIEIDTCLHQPRREGMPQVMKAQVGNLRLVARGVESPQEVSGIDPVTVHIDKDVIVRKLAYPRSLLEHIEGRSIQRQRVLFLVFLLRDIEVSF